MDKLYSSKEVADKVGIRPCTVHQYHRNHGIGERRFGHSIVFTDADIEEIKRIKAEKWKEV